MSHHYIEEHNIVDLYLMGKLSTQETARFEMHFINCEHCIGMLEETAALRQALKETGAKRVARPEASLHRGLFAWMADLHAWQQAFLAIAAILIIILLPLMFFIKEMRDLRQQLNQARDYSVSQPSQSNSQSDQEHQPATPTEDRSQSAEPKVAEQRPSNQSSRAETVGDAGGLARPQVNTPIFVLSAVRDVQPGATETPNEIVIKRSPEWFVISIELERELSYASYRATIFTAGNNLVWRDNTLLPNRYNALTIGFNSSFFRPGNYLLTLEGLSHSGPAVPLGNYSFRITKK